jgi:hypothetical protein
MVDMVIGERVLIYGLDIQSSNSFPPAVRNFEYGVVESISGSSITLRTALVHSYDANWPETGATGALTYGAPRVLSMHRIGRFVEITELVIDGLKWAPNASWTEAFATAQRNGRPVFAGFNKAEVKNCTMTCGCYISQGSVFTFDRCMVTEEMEIDKMLTQIDLNNCSIPLGIGGGSAINVVRFNNCEFGARIFPDALDLVSLKNCRMKGVGQYSADLVTIQNSCPSLVVEDCVFDVQDVARTHLFASAIMRSAAFTKVSSTQFSLTTAAYLASLTSRVLRVNEYLYDSTGRAVAQLRKLPYSDGLGNVLFDVQPLQTFTSGGTLYFRGVNRVDLRGNRFEGPYGYQVLDMQKVSASGSHTNIFPPLYGRHLTDESITIESWMCPADLAGFNAFAPGANFWVREIVLTVYTPYTGASATHKLITHSNYSGDAALTQTFDLKVAGMRGAFKGGTWGGVASDVLSTSMPPTHVTGVRVRASNAITVATPEEAAVWTLQYLGRRTQL